MKDLSEYKEDESIWKIKEIEGFIYMQLKKPGYACNPQEFVENKMFVSCTQTHFRRTMMQFHSGVYRLESFKIEPTCADAFLFRES